MSKRDIRNTVQWYLAHKRLRFYIERLIEWFALDPYDEEVVRNNWRTGEVRLRVACHSEIRVLFLGYLEHALRSAAAGLEKTGVQWKESGVDEVTEYLRQVALNTSEDELKGFLEVCSGVSQVREATERGQELLRRSLLDSDMLLRYVDKNHYGL